MLKLVLSGVVLVISFSLYVFLMKGVVKRMEIVAGRCYNEE